MKVDPDTLLTPSLADLIGNRVPFGSHLTTVAGEIQQVFPRESNRGTWQNLYIVMAGTSSRDRVNRIMIKLSDQDEIPATFAGGWIQFDAKKTAPGAILWEEIYSNNVPQKRGRIVVRRTATMVTLRAKGQLGLPVPAVSLPLPGFDTPVAATASAPQPPPRPLAGQVSTARSNRSPVDGWVKLWPDCLRLAQATVANLPPSSDRGAISPGELIIGTATAFFLEACREGVSDLSQATTLKPGPKVALNVFISERPRFRTTMTDMATLRGMIPENGSLEDLTDRDAEELLKFCERTAA